MANCYLTDFGPVATVGISLLLLILHTMHCLGVHDVGVYNVGVHDVPIHCVGGHWVGVRNVGVDATGYTKQSSAAVKQISI